MTLRAKVSQLSGPLAGTVLGVPLVAVLHAAGYGGDLPLVPLLVLVVIVCAVLELFERRDLTGGAPLYLLTGVPLLAQMAIIGGMGWLPAVAAAHLSFIGPAIRKHGSAVAPAMTAYSVLLLAAGQGAVAMGWVTSYVPKPQVYALTTIAALLQIISGKSFGDAARQSEDATRQRDVLEAAMASSERRFRSLVQRSFDVVSVIDSTSRISYMSPSCRDILGYDPEDLVGSDAFALLHPDEMEAATTDLGKVLDGTGTGWSEFRIRHANGSWRWCEHHIENLLDDPDVNGIVINQRDVTERKMWEQRLAHEASHDILTGLANRGAFLEHLQVALQEATHHNSVLAVLFVDLDGFKAVNDTFGHHCGDLVLQEVARRLQSALGPDDRLARFAGDEFTVLLPDMPHVDHAQNVVERITDALCMPIDIGDGNNVCVGASVGVAVTVKGDQPPEVLLREADAAMYEAKSLSSTRTALTA